MASTSIVESPAGRLLDENPVVREHSDQLAHEQGIAAGGRREAAQEFVGQPGGAEHVGGEFGGRAGVEATEVDRLGHPPADGDEVGPDLAQFGPGEGQHENRHVLHPLDEVLDEVEEQCVGPLDVVEDEHEPVRSDASTSTNRRSAQKFSSTEPATPVARPLRSRSRRSRSGTPAGTSVSRSRARSTSTIGASATVRFDVAPSLDRHARRLAPPRTPPPTGSCRRPGRR